MNRQQFIHIRPLLLVLSLALLFACHLTQSGKTEAVFDFTDLKSAIAGADSAYIVLKDTNGNVVDTLFNGPVTPFTSFKNLPAPHYVGGKAIISISATTLGKVVYQVERAYDGARGEDIGTITLVSHLTRVKLEWPLPKVREGDSLILPKVKIEPENLANSNLLWFSRHPHLLGLTVTHIKGLAPGTANLVIVLASDTTKKDSIEVQIVAKNAPIKVLDSLRLSPDPLTIALRGPPGIFALSIYPANVSSEVLWTSLDTSILSVSQDGSVVAKAEGQGRVQAQSRLEPVIADTAWVKVLPAQKVDSVVLERDSLEIFADGTAEEIIYRIFPALANQTIQATSRNVSVAVVDGGKVRGIKEGETDIQVQSIEDATQTDSLRVIVYPAQKVDSVKVAPDSLRLYVNGESRSFTASIYPTTLQGRFTWRTGESKVAIVDGNGKVSPVSEGKTFVSVRARADSTRKDSSLVIVKKDTPRLKVGSDTVISAGVTLTFLPEATQEYGRVVMFKWDLDGDGIYEDSSTSIESPLSHHYAGVNESSTRFYIRDTEGNDTVVVRKVKTVHGRVVQITNPADGAFVNTTPITVTWTVDGISQSNSQSLSVGANTITRNAYDSAGISYAHGILINLDQSPPNQPTIKASALPINSLTPNWTWSSGGGGGNGVFRYRFDNSDLTGGITTTDTFLVAPLSAGIHTLFVQERDEAGNWSSSAQGQIRIDTTSPPAPSVSVLPASPSRNPQPTWSWTGGAGDAHRYYRFKLDNDDFRIGARDTTATSFTPATDLSDTVHTLYVQERDSAGNWSATGSRSITIDTQAPSAPTVSVSPSELTNDETPTWSWVAGTGGSGTFRWKLNDANLDIGSIESSARTFTPINGLGAGTHTLYVQERDGAGNWSASGHKQVRIDLTSPGAPRIDSTPYSPLNTLRPRWTWRSGMGGAKVFRARVDNFDLSGSPEQTDSSFSPSSDLAEGSHKLYVQERDSAGNWSESTSRSIHLSLRGQVGDYLSSGGLGNKTTSIVLDASDVPIVAYSDPIAGGQVRVKTVTPLGWELVGIPVLDEGSAESIQLILDRTNKLYLAYKEWQQDAGRYKIHMRSRGAIDWIPLGDDDIRTVMNSDEIFAFVDEKSTPYIAYRDWVVSPDSLDGWNQISILKFEHERWEVWCTLRDTYLKGFVIDSKGRPLIVDGGNTVFRYDPLMALWSQVSSGLPASARTRDIVLDREGNPTITYAQSGPGYGEFVAVLKNEKWENLGSEGYSISAGQDHAIAFGPENSPFVAYQAYEVGYAINIKTLVGNSWETIGPPGKTIGKVHYPDLAISKNGIPFISHASEINGKATVTKTAFDLP